MYAAAKSLQLCPTLSDPMDCSLPGSSIHGYWSGVPLPAPRQNSSVLVYGKLLKIKQQGT